MTLDPYERPRDASPDPPIEPDDDYQSPVVARLGRRPERSRSPVRQILAAPADPTDDRLAALEHTVTELQEHLRVARTTPTPQADLSALTDRIAAMERQQAAILTNLEQAYQAFRQLTQRLDSLSQ